MKEPIEEGVDGRFRKVWDNLKQRCLNKNNPKYKFYGERGIKVCKKWKEYSLFEEDMYLSYVDFIYENGSDILTRPTLDRIDNNGNYCKENCRWLNIVEQQKNRRKRRRNNLGIR